MGGFSLIHWLMLGVVVLLLFGGNRFSSMMGDVAKGLKSFKQGMAEDDPAHRPVDPRALPPQVPPVQLPPQQQAYTPPPQAYSPPPVAAQPPTAPPPEPVVPKSPAAHPDQVEMVPDRPANQTENQPSPPRGVPPGGDQTS
jgi:sec-independent protein translocase protein TatA